MFVDICKCPEAVCFLSNQLFGREYAAVVVYNIEKGREREKESERERGERGGERERERELVSY